MEESFGKEIERLRREKGLGLREAARLAGLDPSTWSKLESGQRPPPNPSTKPDEAVETISRISKVVNKSEGDGTFHLLLALATLPPGSPEKIIDSLGEHFRRTITKR